jgi:Ca2+-binding EF-hand superfamily protein
MSEPEVHEVQQTRVHSVRSSASATAPPASSAAARRARGEEAPAARPSESSAPDSFRASTEPASGSSLSLDLLGLTGQPSDSTTPRQPTRPTNFRAEHQALDKDGDGQVSARDLEGDASAFSRMDANEDGKLSRREYRVDFHRQNSFQALDVDSNGQLSAEEMARLSRFGSGHYDENQDGQVDAAEFVTGRKAEMQAARRERIEQKLAGLQGADKDRMVQKFDADGDGQVTASEVLAGHRQARQEQRAGLGQRMFDTLAGGSDSFTVADHKTYREYDADGDGQVSRQEFLAGQGADYQALREGRYRDGSPAPEARERLGIDAAGRPLPGSTTAPVDLGNLQNLTWDQAVELVRSQGGQPFEDGQPTVLAVRTDNDGTKAYEDVFVVLKPDGQMKAFAGTTRPGFTTPSGGWNPEMVLPGNYTITPRWRDGKFNNDAFIVGSSQTNMTVPTAVDRNGDGVYSASEMAAPSSSDEIRLHRGNAETTSSAGCFNVQDYDAFLAFLGGRDVSFNLTLVQD